MSAKAPPLEEVEIPRRGYYTHRVEIKEIGSVLAWRFSTRKKNIGFGLFFQPTGPADQQLLPEQYRMVFSALAPGELKIVPPPKKQTIMERYRSRILPTSHSTLPTSTPPDEQLDGTTSSTALPSRAKTGSLSRRSVSSMQSALQEHTDETTDGELPDIEVLPVQRYESYKFEVNGSLRIPLAGIYVLRFDNSFSINTAKSVYYSVRVTGPFEEPQPAAVEPTAEPPRPRLASWLLKRKKKRMQGWAKRWAELEDGVLSYYDEPGGTLHGAIPLAACTATKVPNRWKLILDSGALVYHFRALNAEDYLRWLDALSSYKQVRSESALVGDRAVARQLRALAEQLQAASSLLHHGSNTLFGLAEREHIGLEEQRGLVDVLTQAVAKITGVMDHTASLVASPQARQSATSYTRHSITDAVVAAAHTRELSLGSSADTEDIYYDADDVVMLADSSDESETLTDATGGSLVESVEHVSVERMMEALELASGADASVSRPALAGPPPLERPGLALPDVSDLPVDTIPRRTVLPAPMVPNTASLGAILRRNIGKEFSAISMPICTNEPVNVLQRLAEEVQHARLLLAAARCDDANLRLALVSAFAVSTYAASLGRAGRKPFNPLLGETYELVRPDLGFRFVAEKVSHQPPIMACHAEAAGVETMTDDPQTPSAFTYWHDLRVRSKFWGKSLEIIPAGTCHAVLRGEHYMWNKVTSCIHNAIGGTPWVEHYGEMVVRNLTTGAAATLEFKKEKGFFASSSSNEVAGLVRDSLGNAIYLLHGAWHASLALTPVSALGPSALGLATTPGPPALVPPGLSLTLWHAPQLPPGADAQYSFSALTITLNELGPDLEAGALLPPTDTRLRPDQRLYELGQADMADALKKRLEETQRERRRHLDTEASPWQPRWFTRQPDVDTGIEIYAFTGTYWMHRDQRTFSRDLQLWPANAEAGSPILDMEDVPAPPVAEDMGPDPDHAPPTPPGPGSPDASPEHIR